MRVNLDPEGLRTSMQLWRDAVDLKMELAPSIRSHMMVKRRQILSNYALVARHWLTLLTYCVPDPGEESQLQSLRKDIEDFNAWAEGEFQAITTLSNE